MKKKSDDDKNITIKIHYGIFDYFPVILDYDFENNRPRGLSARVDFFAYGCVAALIDGIELTPYVFLKKQNTFFEKGMFLADFSKLAIRQNDFADMIKKLNVNKVYIEKSKKFPLGKILEKLEGIEIVFLEV